MAWKNVEQRRKYINTYRQEIRDGIRKVNHGNHPTRKGSPIKCDYCGNQFYRSPANRFRKTDTKTVIHQFCSRKCMSESFKGRASPKKSEWKIFYCVQCGEKLERPLWFAGQNKKSFCNHTCFGLWKSDNWTAENNPAWMGGHHHYYGPNWDRQARRARARDGHKCRKCGVFESSLRRKLDVHHLKPFRLFGITNYKKANLLSNLLSLCPSCHCSEEKNQNNDPCS